MTIILDLEPSVARRLEARAQSAGTTVERYLAGLVEASVPPLPLSEAISLYAERKVSQGLAAELAGVSRARFLQALSEAHLPVFQYTAEDVIAEATRG